MFVCSLVDCDEYRQNTSAFNVIVTEKEVCIKFSFSSVVHSINEWTMTAFHLLRSNQTCAVFSSGEKKSSVYTFWCILSGWLNNSPGGLAAKQTWNHSWDHAMVWEATGFPELKTETDSCSFWELIFPPPGSRGYLVSDLGETTFLLFFLLKENNWSCGHTSQRCNEEE